MSLGLEGALQLIGEMVTSDIVELGSGGQKSRQVDEGQNRDGFANFADLDELGLN